MNASPLSVALLGALALAVLGIAGMLLRRSLLVVVMCGALAQLGAALALIALGATENQPRPVAAGLILLLIAAAWSLAGSAVALATYRRRGSENVDEMQELSG